MDLGNSHVMIDGQFVSARIERLVLAIKDYEPDIDVKWTPPGAREQGMAAYKIIYAPVGQSPFTLFHVASDEDFDERILMKIIANDQRNGQKATMSDLEAWEATQKLMAKQDYLDRMEEAQDIAKHVVGSPLNTYRVNNNLVIKGNMPFNAKDY